MPRLLITIILCALFLVGTLHSAILSRFKDGVSIDSLVEHWRPVTYTVVKALLEKEKVKFTEEEEYSCYLVGTSRMIIVHFNKVYYRGLYIGGGYMFFGHDSKSKVRYPLIFFRTEIPQ